MDYLNKKVLVLGLGESGLSAAQWLARCGAVLRVADTREAPERLAQLMELVPECEFVSGQFTADLLDGIDFIVVSPGLSELNELQQIAPIAAERGIAMWSEIELFAQSLQYLRETQQYQPKVLAITGTNGKTTVTSLVGLLVERSGKTVKIAGNISPAVLDVLRICMDEHALPEVWVLELSSFQLHSTFSLQADAATVLNLTQDHLDWHGDMAAYADDKARIFSDRTVQVLNRDDSLVMQMQKVTADLYTFGQSLPKTVNEFGLSSEHDMNWLCVANPVDDEVAPPKRRSKNQPIPEVEIVVSRLMPADALKIRGKHNAVNALAALALCRAIQLPLAPLLHGLREYTGEPHRVELIATIAEVEYYDDSKGTNVGATAAALNGLGDPHSKIVLIAGGVGKGQDFAPLHDSIARYVSVVCLIGLATEEIAQVVDGTGVEIIRCENLEQAVIEASHKARNGDKVLLSPACASFDMFKNYAHRAQVFIDAVKEVGYSRGEVA